MHRLLGLPVVIQLILVLASGMAVAALVALALGDFENAAVFGVFCAVVTSLGVMAAIAVWERPRRSTALGRGITGLLVSYAFIPLLAALPLYAMSGESTLGMAYFEMVSAFSTTGATLYLPGDLPGIAHFWRALVAWIGGGVILVVAVAVLAPLKIGGFEMGQPARNLNPLDDSGPQRADPSARLGRVLRQVLPIYLGLTVLLGLVLVGLGENAFVALCHAMGILSTSGISPVGGLAGGEGGFVAEVAILAFLLFALSHRVYGGAGVFGSAGPFRDPEVQTGIVLIGAVSFVLVAQLMLTKSAEGSGAAPLQAAWGILFTVTSFLTTTGYQSAGWEATRSWAEVPAVGLVLLTLAFAGGGIATTAGGIKLLRVFALYKHGVREIEKLVHPSSIGGYGATARRIRREGAFVAWVFVMLFFVTYGGLVLALAASGASFETALVLAAASISNTGPLPGLFGPEIASYAELSAEARGVLCIGMLVGRVEVLAVVAVLNPEYWRG